MEGYAHNYEFTITGNNTNDANVDPDSKLASISKSKYFVTNMTTKVSGKISGKKLILTKAKGAYLFKKSKMRNFIFTKSQNLGKAKYSYRLARNYKIVYGTKEDGSGDIIKSKAWFNKNFKKRGKMYGKYNIGVCLDKKNQVNMIYISAFDVGAEQTD